MLTVTYTKHKILTKKAEGNKTYFPLDCAS